VVALALGCLAWSGARADVRVARVFGDHMVLQQELPILVWGWAAPGEEVRVALAGQTARAKAGADGAWRAELPAMQADGKPYTMTVKGAKNEITFTDVMLGEVWLASGQSNMGRTAKITQAMPGVRVFWRRLGEPLIPRKDDFGPDDKVGWCPAVPETLRAQIPEQTAPRKEAGDIYGEVAYVFARQLHEELQVPVGIMNIAWGGSSAAAWTPRRGIEQELPFDQPAAAKLSHMPGAMYQTLLRSVVPFTVRGVIWYQGEDDGRSPDYERSLTDLIASWRAAWRQPALPFYLAQIAPTTYASGMLAVWEAQVKVWQRVPHTGLAFSNDIYEGYKGSKADEVRLHTGNAQEAAINWPVSGGGNPHPPNKQLVAGRLAALALVQTYHRPDRPLYGPLYAGHEIVGDKVRVKFKYAYDGLRAFDGQALNWFELSDGTLDGKGRKLVYVKARARIVGPDTVEVTADGVAQPKFVRFSWHALARNNLVNSGNLPAMPFRTDTQKDPRVR